MFKNDLQSQRRSNSDEALNWHIRRSYRFDRNNATQRMGNNDVGLVRLQAVHRAREDTVAGKWIVKIMPCLIQHTQANSAEIRYSFDITQNQVEPSLQSNIAVLLPLISQVFKP